MKYLILYISLVQVLKMEQPFVLRTGCRFLGVRMFKEDWRIMIRSNYLLHTYVCDETIFMPGTGCVILGVSTVALKRI